MVTTWPPGDAPGRAGVAGPAGLPGADPGRGPGVGPESDRMPPGGDWLGGDWLGAGWFGAGWFGCWPTGPGDGADRAATPSGGARPFWAGPPVFTGADWVPGAGAVGAD